MGVLFDNVNSISNLMFQYLRIIKDIAYNRDQSKKICPIIFSLKRQHIRP